MTIQTALHIETLQSEPHTGIRQTSAGQAHVKRKKTQLADMSQDDVNSTARASISGGDIRVGAVSYSATGLTLKVTEAKASMLGSQLVKACYAGPKDFTVDCMIGNRRIEIGYRAAACFVGSPEKIEVRPGTTEGTLVLNVRNGEGRRSAINVVIGHTFNGGRDEHWIRVVGEARALLNGHSICPAEDTTKSGDLGPSLSATWPFIVVLAFCKTVGMNYRTHGEMLQAVLAGLQNPKEKQIRIAEQESIAWLRPASQAVAVFEKSRGLSRHRAVAELVNDLGHLCNFDEVDFVEALQEGIEAWAMQTGGGGTAHARISIIDDSVPHHFIRTVQKHKELLPVCIVVASKNAHLASALKPHLSVGDNEAIVIDDNSSRKDIDRALRLSKLCFVVGSTEDFPRSQPLTRLVTGMVSRKVPMLVLSTEPSAAWGNVLVNMGVPNNCKLTSHSDIQFAAAGAKSIERFVTGMPAYVGSFGTAALAGLALVFPLVMLQQMMSAGAMGGGVSSAIARAIGAGDDGRTSKLALHAAIIGTRSKLFPQRFPTPIRCFDSHRSKRNGPIESRSYRRCRRRDRRCHRPPLRTRRLHRLRDAANG